MLQTPIDVYQIKNYLPPYRQSTVKDRRFPCVDHKVVAFHPAFVFVLCKDLEDLHIIFLFEFDGVAHVHLIL